ncbi:hypothetical protein [Mixta sp. Marseille-Q2659]|uniref:hypothetical protein n=1 Tax=Mixta sp. Marseille-Q2659 TaxID=2736607 RepID=UPI0023BA2DBE|nr:hypothetical protein [Mixta sp. Marseille-Q2659]
MHINFEEDVWLDDYGMRRKEFIYDHRIHHSYVFVAGKNVYTVITGTLTNENLFTRIGYEMPDGIPFPLNGVAEVYFDVCHGMNMLADFRHVLFPGLGSAVVLQSVALAMIAHLDKFNVGGFVFQAAAGGVVDMGRKISLEEIYDYLLGLKNEPRYNRRTGLRKKTPRSLLPVGLRAYKRSTRERACYVVLQ